MVEENHTGRLVHAEVHHEPSDAGFRVILAVVLVSIILGLILYAALFRFMFRYSDYLAKTRASSFPVAVQQRKEIEPGPGSHPLNGGTRAGQREPLPLEPRLDPINVREGVPEGSIAELYARDTEILHSYGPAQEKEFVHVPIERAMAFLADKLPVRERTAQDGKRRTDLQSVPQHGQGLRDWGEPNSGRLFRERQP
jgi:hypothetical protein